MTLFFYLIIALITFFAFLHAWAKKDYDVSRTVVINKPREEVFNFVRQLKKQPLWNPLFNRDTNAVLKYKGEDGKVGASFYWKGNSKVGEGIQRIVKTKQGRVFETKVLFVKPVKVNALTYVGVKELESEKTKMVWGTRGQLPFPLTIISIFYSPEKALGEKFDEGLRELKQILELN
ncbi:SRPBCC family protein [Christiangramia sabulilitoris]|uniref:SRPBCC family protein n=1 Tax=Christiangramia sabulilitoris TaxID=2583991 RepID=A0A550I6P8_9FLAO|nr:SRPBCC family protein [Christiangramia sabulilitoris]TRO66643.1 SRPBCC family protein [Christiangramia sabulilitoris]